MPRHCGDACGIGHGPERRGARFGRAVEDAAGQRVGNFQIALSAILLIGAGLFVRTLVNLSRTPLGFREDHILLFQLNPPRARYREAQSYAFYRQLEEKLTAIPGVRSASMSNIAIIGDGRSGAIFHVVGTAKEEEAVRVQ